MDFVVKLGETGSAFPYTHIPPTEKYLTPSKPLLTVF